MYCNLGFSGLTSDALKIYKIISTKSFSDLGFMVTTFFKKMSFYKSEPKQNNYKKYVQSKSFLFGLWTERQIKSPELAVFTEAQN